MARNQSDSNDDLKFNGFDIIIRENSTFQTVDGAVLDLVGSVLINGVPPSGGGGGGIADGDKGDIVVTDTGATWTIENGAVSLGKLATIATDRLLGRATSGTGTVELIVCTAAGRDLIDDADPAAQRTTLGLAFGATASQATLEELIRDTIGVALQGSGIQVSVNDGTDQITLSVSDADKGDITVSATGATWTIDNGVVTNAKLANIATARIRGRVTASTGVVEDLTGTQVTTLLDTFTSALKGLAPASGGGTTNYLRADGTWAAPPGSGGLADGDKGDITVSSSGTVWDIDAGVVGTTELANDAVSNAKLANVATSTFKGRVTASTGDPEDLTGTQATTLLDVFTTALKGLAPASGGGTTNFLRADGTWAAPPGGGGGISGIAVQEDNATVVATATGLDFKNGFDVVANSAEAEVSLDLGEYSGNNLPNAKVAGLGSLALLSTIGSSEITNGSVALADMANLAQDQFIGRVTASTGVPETATITAAARTVLDDISTAAMLSTLGAQPVDADLTTIASLTATTDNFIVSVSSAWASRTPAQVRTTLGLVVGTNVQAFDADLTTIAGLTATTDNVIQSVAGAWASRTPAQLKTTLSLVKGDVGLGNVDNTSDATKDAATSTLTNKTLTDPKINQSLNPQTGTTYTAVLTDSSKMVTLTNGSAITFTIPLNSSVAFPVGSRIDFAQMGAGQVTVAATGGVTINATPGLKLRAQYSGASIIKLATDTWLLVGDLAA